MEGTMKQLLLNGEVQDMLDTKIIRYLQGMLLVQDMSVEMKPLVRKTIPVIRQEKDIMKVISIIQFAYKEEVQQPILGCFLIILKLNTLGAGPQLFMM